MNAIDLDNMVLIVKSLSILLQLYTLNCCDNYSGPSARDLSRMFPTPPSPPTPQCSIASPMMQTGETILPADTLITHDSRLLHHHHYHHPVVSTVCTTTDQPSPIAAAVLALQKVQLIVMFLLWLS